MYISSASPNKRSLGATNGIVQMMLLVQRMVGLAAAASLFTFSLNKNILGGKFVYAVLLKIVCAGFGISVQLSENMWDHNEQ